MPRKILVDYNQVQEVIRSYVAIVEEEKDKIVIGHPAREKLLNMLTPCDVFLKSLRDLARYDSKGNLVRPKRKI